MLRLAREALVAIRVTLLVAIGVAVFGCASPTLPLPPPLVPTISAGTEPNTWHLASEGGALPNAIVVVVNRNETLPRGDRVTGTIADERGSWEVTVVGQAGDFVDISQESGSTSSPMTTVQLR